MAVSKLQIVIEAQNQAKGQLDNLSRQLKNISDDQREFATNTEQARQSFLGFTSSISVGVLAANAIQGVFSRATRALGGFISSSVDTALSVERIAATLPILAKNTGKTEEEIRSIIKAIRDENKSIREATEVTRGIVLAGLDQVDALKLIKVARDVGATVGRSSADVNRLILESFQTLNPGILKQVGLNISLRETYRNLAKQTGKNVTEFTTLERQQALLNAIFGEGAKFAGAYDAAMTTVQKVTNSVKDASEDIKFVLGSLITKGFFPIVSQVLLAVRAFRKWAITSENILRPELEELAEKIGRVVVGTFNALVNSVRFLIRTFRQWFNILKEKGIIDAFIETIKKFGQILTSTVLPALKLIMGDTQTWQTILFALFAVITIGIASVFIPLALALVKIALVVVGVMVVIKALTAGLTEVFFRSILLQNAIVEAFTNIGKKLVEFKNTIVETFTSANAFAGLFLESMGQLAKDLINFFVGVIAFLLDFFLPGWEGMLANMFVSAREGIQAVVEIFEFLKGAIGNILTLIGKVLLSFLAKTNEVFSMIKSVILIAVNFIKNTIQAIVNPIQTAWTNLWNSVRDVFIGVWEAIDSTFGGIIGGIVEKIESLINKIITLKNALGGISTGVVGTVGGAISDIIKRGASITGLAEGGIVTRPTLAKIGEAGPEAVIPLNRLGGLAGGANIIINFNGDVFGEDADRIGKIVGDGIIERLGLNMRIG